jgi:hypothetical protein
MQSIKAWGVRIKQHHADFLLVLLLFFLFRMMMLMAYSPPSLIYSSDYLFYFNVADLSKHGQFPFIHFWYEFPPIFPFLNLAAYYLAQGTFHNYVSWMGAFLLLAECGILILLYRLACRLYKQSDAVKLSWVYALLFVPLYVWRATFDSLTTFSMLLVLYALLNRRFWLVNLLLGLGVMIKYIPVILLPSVWRNSSLSRMIQAFIVILVISLIIFGPFFILNPQFSVASLTAQIQKSSWQTIWALIDGNRDTGSFGPLSYRFDVEKAATPSHNPPRISPLITLLIFGTIGLYTFLRPVRLPADLDTITFAAFTVVIFFLWSKGWSPQWQLYLIPLVLLSLPLGKSLMYIISLSLVNFLEWPLIYQRELTQLLPLTIMARTLLFALLAYELYRRRVYGTMSRVADSKAIRSFNENGCRLYTKR